MDKTDSGTSFGAALLQNAVSKLNVETVRFLVNSGVFLGIDVYVPPVYEDDAEQMAKLDTMKYLLAKVGQGQLQE